MEITALYFFGILLFCAALVALVTKKKITSPQLIRYVTIIHFIFLVLTILLIVLWSFRIHLPGRVAEIIPFWICVFSGIFIFGFMQISGFKKAYFAFVFYAHLFFSVIIFIPLLGLALALPVYSYFIPDNVIYENSQLRLQGDPRSIMPINGSPYVYFKCGAYELKRQSHVGPVYSPDSVKLTRLDDKNVQLKIYDSHADGISTVQADTIACGCF